jgi:hypothetical protein
VNGQNDSGHELNQADCDRCLAILQQRGPMWAEKLERLKRAGFDLQEPAQRNLANLQGAQGILQEYFPGRAPITISPVG